MSKNRRIAAICGGAVAAISGTLALTRGDSHSDHTYGLVGLLIGVFVGVALVALVRFRTKRSP